MSEVKNNVNLFSVALKSIAFAWQTNRRLLVILILLNVFQGSIIYLQFTSFSAIVDEIIKIKLGTGTTRELELMQLKGKYAELYTMQAKRYLENEEKK